MKKSNIFSILILQLFIGLVLPTHGQEDSKLSKFLPNYSTDDPSALYNGIPNISIPLLTLEGKGVSVPVSISYDASGITVVQEATDVGLGWVLNAGGHIIQETRSHWDFDSIDRVSSLPQAQSVEQNGDEWESEYDNLPDNFYFSCNGLSGRFMLAEDLQTGLVFPDQPIKISMDRSGFDWEFTITDEKGVKYIFDRKQQYGPSSSDVQTTVYTLDAIYSPVGDTISFTYNSVQYNKKTFSSVYDPLTEEYFRTSTSNLMPLNQLTSISLSGGESISVEYGSKRKDCAVEYPNEVKMIDKIKLLNAQGDTIKYFKFHQGYFVSENYTQYLPKPKHNYPVGGSGYFLKGEYTLKDDNGDYHTYDSIDVSGKITGKNTIHYTENGSRFELEDYYSRGLYVMIDSNDATYAILNTDYLSHYMIPFDSIAPFSYDSTTSPYSNEADALAAWENYEADYNRRFEEYMEANYSPTMYHANHNDNEAYYFQVDTAYMTQLTTILDSLNGDDFRPFYKSNLFSYRLKLDSIVETSGLSGDENPPIVIEYNSTKLPDYYSSDIDHWGYYNYREGKPNSYPTPEVGMTNVFGTTHDRGETKNYFGNRGADEDKMKANILEKIIYPYGGYVKYDFEANRARSTWTSDTSFLVGGLRLKSVETGTGTGSKYFTNYEYKEFNDHWVSQDYKLDTTGKCSGFLRSKEVQYEVGVGWEYVGTPGDDGHWEMVKGRTDNSVLQLSKTKSGYVGYSSVAVSKEDETGNNLGKTLYRFYVDTTTSDYYGISSSGWVINNYNDFMAYTSQPYPADPKGGKLKEKIIADDSRYILEKSVYAYTETYPENNRFFSTGADSVKYYEFIHAYTESVGDIATPYVSYIDPEVYYSLLSPTGSALASVHNSKYYSDGVISRDSVFYVYDTDGSGFLITSPNMEDESIFKISDTTDYSSSIDGYYVSNGYEFLCHHTDQLIQELKFTEDGKEIRKRYWYPPHLEDKDSVYEKMVERNMVSIPVKIETIQDTTRMDGERTWYGVFSKSGSSSEDFILPDLKEQYYVDQYDPVREFKRYDDYASPIEVLNTNGNYSANVWRNRKLKIASIENAKYDEIILQDFEEDTVGYGDDWKIYDQSFSTQDYSDEVVHTGKKSIKLTSVNSSTTSYISAKKDINDLDSEGTYSFTAWVKADTVESSGPDILLYYKTSSGTTQADRCIYNSSKKGEWQQLKVECNLDDYTGVEEIEARVRFLGTNSVSCYVDDLRLYPSDAQMTTYTNEPLVGKTSEINPSGQTTIYEYDDFGRLYQVKDDDGNILKQHTYHFKE